MADSKLLLLGGAAAAAYWWFYLRVPPVAAAVVAPGGVPVVPVVTPVVPVVPVVDPNSLAAIQARVIAKANAPDGLGVDAWDWYVNNELAPLGKVAPDPMTVFGAGWDRSQLVGAADYWAKMGPALRSQGLAGRGLAGWVQ